MKNLLYLFYINLVLSSLLIAKEDPHIERTNIADHKNKIYQFYDNILLPKMNRTFYLMETAILYEKKKLSYYESKKLSKNHPKVIKTQKLMDYIYDQMTAIRAYKEGVASERKAQEVKNRKWTVKNEGQYSRELLKHEDQAHIYYQQHQKLTGLKMLKLKYQYLKYKKTKKLVQFCNIPTDYQKFFKKNK